MSSRFAICLECCVSMSLNDPVNVFVSAVGVYLDEQRPTTARSAAAHVRSDGRRFGNV